MTQAAEDVRDGVTYVQRTTREMTKAMCDLTDFLHFTGEDCSMFKDNCLPTLDTILWVSNCKIKHKFYEKPTVGNQVLMKNTALPLASLRASLLQETIKRLQNCSLDLDIVTKQEILSSFGKKLIKSGHSIKSARIILVQGVAKFLWKVKLSKLPTSDPSHKPLYMSKEFCEEDRQVSKYQAKMNWFKKTRVAAGNPDAHSGWRSKLKGVWRGLSMRQKTRMVSLRS